MKPALILAGWMIVSLSAFAQEPRWWKGNLHTHSLWSDGDDFPEMIAEMYRDRGYHFLAFSDHNVLSQGERWMAVSNIAQRARGEPWHAGAFTPRDAFAAYLQRFGPNWVETRTHTTHGHQEVRLKPFDEYRALVDQAGRFLLIQAEEITHGSTNGLNVHLGAINVHERIPPQTGQSVPEIIARTLKAVRDSATAAGREVLVHVNHPNYKWGVTAEELASVIEEQFFEVWNGVDGDNDPGDATRPSTDEIWDIANTLRLAGFGAPPLLAVATDDSHDYQGNKRRAPPGRAWVQVRSRFLTPESLIRALRAGDFYATTGVLLSDIRYDATSRRLALNIEAQGTETYSTRFVGTRRGVLLKGKSRLDPAGKAVETTLDYRSNPGPPIGEVFAEVTGLSPSYVLRGDELYVRAIVVSSGQPEVPSTEFEFKRAWSQPFGWSISPIPPVTR